MDLLSVRKINILNDGVSDLVYVEYQGKEPEMYALSCMQDIVDANKTLVYDERVKGFDSSRKLQTFNEIENQAITLRVELENILSSMDIPVTRFGDLRWLSRNMLIRNKQHKQYDKAVKLISELSYLYDILNGKIM